MDFNDLCCSKSREEDLFICYKEYYNNVPFPCHVLDSHLNIIDVNPVWEKFLGYSNSEAVGKNISELLHADNFCELKNKLTSLNTNREINNLRSELRHKSGRNIPVLLNGKIFCHEDGNIMNIYCAFHDISHEIETIDKLKESEERYRAVFYGSNSIMLIINPETGDIVDANKAAEEFYGYRIGELKSMNICHINAFPGNVVNDKMQNAIENNENNFLFKHRLANGCLRDVEVYNGKICIGNKELLYSIIHDITESRKNEERLIKAEKIANIGSWEINLNTGEVYLSLGARKIYGLFEDNIDIELIQSFPLAEYRRFLDKAFYELIVNSVPYDVEFKIYRPADGEIIDIHSIAKYKKDSNIVFGVVQDITKQKEIEEDIKKAKDRAEEADRLKSAFLATVSHELRTPLNAIIGLSDIIDENMGMEEILEMNSIINSSGHNLLDVIETILDISLVETAKFKINNERFLLSMLFADIKDFVRRESMVKPNLDIKYIPQNNNFNISIYSDFARIRKVLKNLLKNAIKFTENGYVDYGYVISNDAVIFYVKDSGVGIPDDKKEKIFESFRQLDDSITRKYAGIGLGLTVCKKIADVLAGDIWVESEKEAGSVFYFKLKNVDIKYI